MQMKTTSFSLSRRKVLTGVAATMLAVPSVAAVAVAGPDPLLVRIQTCLDLKRDLYAAQEGAHAERLAFALIESYEKFAGTIPTTRQGVRAKQVFAEKILERNPDVFDMERIETTIAIAKKRLKLA
jgi:hypothetical protein